jgi:hypothetical protein
MCSEPAAARTEPSKSLVLLLCDSYSRFAVQSAAGRANDPRIASPPQSDGYKSIDRQQDANGCSFSGLALGFHASAVQLRDVFNDGKSQTGPTEFAAAGFVSAVKAFEDAW